MGFLALPSAREVLGAPEVGEVIAGKYRVDSVLGQGGMAVVVAATHVELRHRVAIKFLRLQELLTPAARTRFEREARIIAGLQSEHIVRVLDYGSAETLPYMVMEYLDGTDLGDLLHEVGRLSPEQAVEYVLQACEGLAVAHAKGIVHRDLKPANLFLSRRADGSPLIKILDFGVSKAPTSHSVVGLTGDESALGTPQYMSPEQMADPSAVDPRTDVWALGAILHELIAGRSPFAAETLHQVIVKIATETPRPLSTDVPGVPPGVETAVLRALQKEPNARFSSVAELAAALVPSAPLASQPALGRVTRILAPEPPQISLSNGPPLSPAAANALGVAPTAPRILSARSRERDHGEAKAAGEARASHALSAHPTPRGLAPPRITGVSMPDEEETETERMPGPSRAETETVAKGEPRRSPLAPAEAPGNTSERAVAVPISSDSAPALLADGHEESDADVAAGALAGDLVPRSTRRGRRRMRSLVAMVLGAVTLVAGVAGARIVLRGHPAAAEGNVYVAAPAAAWGSAPLSATRRGQAPEDTVTPADAPPRVDLAEPAAGGAAGAVVAPATVGASAALPAGASRAGAHAASTQADEGRPDAGARAPRNNGRGGRGPVRPDRRRDRVLHSPMFEYRK